MTNSDVSTLLARINAVTDVGKCVLAKFRSEAGATFGPALSCSEWDRGTRLAYNLGGASIRFAVEVTATLNSVTGAIVVTHNNAALPITVTFDEAGSVTGIENLLPASVAAALALDGGVTLRP